MLRNGTVTSYPEINIKIEPTFTFSVAQFTQKQNNKSTSAIPRKPSP